MEGVLDLECLDEQLPCRLQLFFGDISRPPIDVSERRTAERLGDLPGVQALSRLWSRGTFCHPDEERDGLAPAATTQLQGRPRDRRSSQRKDTPFFDDSNIPAGALGSVEHFSRDHPGGPQRTVRYVNGDGVGGGHRPHIAVLAPTFEPDRVRSRRGYEVLVCDIERLEQNAPFAGLERPRAAPGLHSHRDVRDLRSVAPDDRHRGIDGDLLRIVSNDSLADVLYLEPKHHGLPEDELRLWGGKARAHSLLRWPPLLLRTGRRR